MDAALADFRFALGAAVDAYDAGGLSALLVADEGEKKRPVERDAGAIERPDRFGRGA